MSTSPETFLLFFYHEDCRSSMSMTTAMRDVQRHFGEDLPCIVLNARSPATRRLYGGVTSTPTLILMRGKQELWRSSELLHSSEVIAAIGSVLRP